MTPPSAPTPLVVAEPRLMRDTIVAARRAGARHLIRPLCAADRVRGRSLLARRSSCTHAAPHPAGCGFQCLPRSGSKSPR